MLYYYNSSHSRLAEYTTYMLHLLYVYVFKFIYTKNHEIATAYSPYPQCTVYDVHCTTYTVHIAVYVSQYTPHSVR